MFDPFSRLLAQSICLTGSDLNSSSKPWNVQVKTTQVVYEEFHDQVNKYLKEFTHMNLGFATFDMNRVAL